MSRSLYRWGYWLGAHSFSWTRYSIISKALCSQAMCSGVKPFLVWTWRSHLLTNFAISKYSLPQAMCKGSSPLAFGMFGSHCVSWVRYATTSISQYLQAICIGVSPRFFVGTFTSQLLTSFTSSSDCWLQAICRGSSLASFSIPWLQCFSKARNLTISIWLALQARCNGVFPWLSRQFTFLIVSAFINARLSAAW